MNKIKKIFIIIWLPIVIAICWYNTRYQKYYFVSVTPVSGDIFKFETSGKDGLINVSTGKIIVKAKYIYMECNKSSEFCVTYNGDYGIINLNGKKLVDNVYDKMKIQNDKIIAVKNEKYSIVDAHGNILLGPLDKGVEIKYSKSQYAIITKDQQYSLIDMEGNKVIDYLPTNTYIYPSYSNDQIVYIINKNNNKRGFINLEENVIVEPVYDSLPLFVNEIAVVKLNNKYGFINDKNEVIIDFKYEDANNFSEGLASVEYNSKFGYIDELGNVVIDYQYDNASDFIDGVAHIDFGDSDGFINKNNERIIPNHNSNHEIEYKNYFNNSKYYYVNNDGSIFYKNWGEDYGLIIDETKIINRKGNIIIDKDFQKIEYINDNMFCIRSRNWECYDMEGEKLFEYEHSIFDAYNINKDLENEGLPLFYFSEGETYYVYNDNGDLIYRSGKGEGQAYISGSNNFIVTTKGNKIITYNINTKEKKEIYKVPFTI
ncbi:WG repeat-containing protein [Mycoplasmatota bacterium]|nr:WG repeat-containing protein [Mycoplasmatota bacterium]